MATKPTAAYPLNDPNLEVIPAPEATKIEAAPKTTAPRVVQPTRDDVARRAAELGVDPKLALSFFAQESSGNWNSKDSPKGAKGGMQVMPGTFKAMMGSDSGQEDPWRNMEAGLRYINYGQRTLKTKDPVLLAAGYHAGYDHPDLKAGKIPNTNDGMISTSDYAKSVAERSLGTPAASANRNKPASAFDELNAAEPGRYEVIDPALVQLDEEEPGRYEVLGQEEIAKFETGLKTQAEIDNKPMLDYLKDKATGGYDSMAQSLAMARWAVAGGDAKALSEQLAKQFSDQAAEPKSTGEKEIDAAFKEVTDAKGAWDTTKKGAAALLTAATNPKALAGEVVGQAANALPTIGAGAAGAGTGAGAGALIGAVPGAVAGAIIGGRAGMAAGTTATELGAEVTDMIGKRLAESKQAPTAQNILALLSDKDFQGEAMKQGLKKGLTVAAIDQVFMGIGGKIATAPVRRAATKELAEQGVDVSTDAARKAALASPAGRAAVDAAKPSVAARVGAGAAAVGVDTAGEVIGEGASQQIARGDFDKGEALREGVASLGSSAVEVGAGVAIERGKAAVAAARATVQPVPNAPSKASGPLARATENASVQPDRVTATAPDGSKVSGTVVGTSDDGKVQIVDDNGEVVTFQTGPGGVKIEQEAPNTPLSNALEVASEQQPEAQDQATAEEVPAEEAQESEPNQAQQPVQPTQAAIETVAKEPAPQPTPVEPPKPVALSDMDEPALRDRLRYIKNQGRPENGGWNQPLVKARREVEKEIDARVKAAQPALDLKPATQQPQGAVNVETQEAVQAAPRQPEKAPEVAPAHASIAPAATETVANQNGAASVQEVATEQGKTAAPGPSQQSNTTTDPAKAKALDRIARGTAYFGSKPKASEWIDKSGLGATHEVVQGKAGRWDVVAKATVKESLPVQPEQPADLGPDTFAGSIKQEIESRAEADVKRKAKATRKQPPERAPQVEPPKDAPYRAVAKDGQFILQNADEDIIGASGGVGERTFKTADDAHQWAASNGFDIDKGPANVNDNNPQGQPASTEEVAEKAGAASAPAATDQPVEKEIGGDLSQGTQESSIRKPADVEPAAAADKPAKKPRTAKAKSAALEYPLAKAGTRYEETSIEPTMMAPDEYLSKVRPLEIDEESRDNIDDLKRHIQSGKTLDPLHIYADGKEDGRHRAVAAKELGIEQVPVIVHAKTIATETKATPAAKERLTDAGEELTRNRRNKVTGITWTDVEGMNDTLKIKTVTKSNVWAKPNYKKMVEDGAPRWKVAILKAIYDKLAAKPDSGRTLTDEQLKRYIDTMGKVRDATMAELDRIEADPRVKAAFESGEIKSFTSKGDDQIQAAAVMGLRSIYSKAIFESVFPGEKPFDRTTEQGKENNANALIIGGNKAISGLQFNYDMLRKARDLLMDGFPAKQEMWEKTLQVGQLPSDKWAVAVKGRSEFQYRAKGATFDTREDAVAAAKEMTKRAKDDKPLPPSRGLDLDAVQRTGPDWRNGKDVTAADVKDHFGFRGVNLGEYVKANQKIAQIHLNHAYDALNDLAEIMGVPPKAISLNGTLGIAIGAQGSGKALAHFVPGVNEINITRDSGAGALAHEWAHAMDHYFAVQAGLAKSSNPFLTEHMRDGAKPLTGIRPELASAFKTMADAMSSRDMTKAEAQEWVKGQRERTTRNLKRFLADIKPKDQAAYDEVSAKLLAGDIGEKNADGVPANLAKYDALTSHSKDAMTKAQVHAAATRADELKDESVFLNLHKPQTATNYAKASGAMDAKKETPYWSSKREMFARAFESYVMDALTDQKRESLYLSGLSDGPMWKAWESMSGQPSPYPKADERLSINHAAQTLVDAIQTKQEETGNVAMFSRSGGAAAPVSRDPAATPAYEAIRQLSRFDEAFTMGDSQAKDIDTIADEMQQGVASELKFTTGKSTALSRGNRKPTLAIYAPGESGNKILDIFDADTDRPYIVIGNSEVGTNVGAIRAYQIAFAWAHNNGKVMRPDPAGLTPINRLRRTMAMISSAYRFGTTEHMEPHQDQYIALTGKAQITKTEPEDTTSSNPEVYSQLETLKANMWKSGKDSDTIASNVQNLITAAYQLAAIREPEIRRVQVVDGRASLRGDVDTGVPLADAGTDADTQKILGISLRPSVSGVGASTVKLLSVASSVQRALNANIGKQLPVGGGNVENGGVGSRSVRALQAIRQTIGDLSQGPNSELSKVMYARGENGSVVSVSDIQPKADAIAANWANKPEIIVVDGMQDPKVPKRVRDEDAKQKSQGASGEPEGFYYDGKVYLVAGQLKSDADVARVLFHEALGHYGLRGLFGKELQPILQSIVNLRRADVAAKAKSYGLDAEDATQMLQAAEEVLAEMAQSTPEIGFVKRAVAAIRAWLRENVPGFKALELSDAEIIRDYILPARGFVERGQQAGKNSGRPAASRGKDQTDTPAFKKWFGDSKVVDADGKPLAVYHGTTADISQFKLGRGAGAVFFAEKPTGQSAAFADGDGGNIMPSYLAIKNPATLEQFMTTGETNEKKAVAILQERGHDGVMWPTEKDGKVWLAFSPTQIKSATGNNGNFDATNPDIRFSVADPVVNEGLTPPEQGRLRKIQASLQDNNNRVRQVQERIEKQTGRKLPEYADYYAAETNRPGRIAARLEDAKGALTGPLMEKLAKSGNTAEQLGELLHAMHAQERNERIAKINPEMPDGGSGMTNAQAAAVLAGYRDNKALHKLADEARAIAKATLELKLAYGLIDIDTFTTLSETYANYVPLKGDGEFGPKIKRAMGHDARDEQILENIARDYDQAVVTGERNLARHSLLQMVLKNPDSNLWTVGVPPKGRYVAGKTYSVMRNGEEVATFTSESQVSAYLEGKGPQAAQYEVVDDSGERVQSFVKPLQDNEVMVYVDGRAVRIQIKDEQLAAQLRPLDQGKMHAILEFMRGVNRYLSKIYTGYNPAFIIANLSRDLMTGTVNIVGNEGAGTAAKAWANYPAALAAMSQWAATKKAPANDAGKYLEEYRQHGGKTGASWMSDLEEQGKTLKRMYDDAYGASGYMADGKPGKAALIAGRKIVGGMAHVVEIANQATENGLRLALYMALRKQGATPGMAAQAAKNVTVNFDRKGAMTPALGAIYLFFNPAVQGTANAMKTLFKGQHKAQAWTALGMLAALGFYAASQGMDEDKDRWLGEGWETRSKKLVLNIGGYKVTVPVSLEFAPFYALGVAMAEASRGESKMATAGRMVSSFIAAYFPLGGVFSSDSDNHSADAMQAAIPTILKPGYQSATNRNSFGSQIVPESEFTKERADNLKMFRGTKNSAYDAAAQGVAKVGELTGAGRYENDITKVSPETLKHLWRTYTGGLGAFVTDTIGAASMAAADPSQVEAGDVPIVKSFVKEQDVKPIRGRFYELAKEAKAVAAEFNQAKKAGDGEAIDQIMNSPEKVELLGLDRLISTTAKAAAKLRDQEVEINADKSLTPAQKRAALKDLEQAEESLYRSAISAFK